MPASTPARRPLKTRNAAWARAVARRLSALGVSPNAISVASLGFALAGAASMMSAAQASTPGTLATLLIVAAACIQLRLLCNMLDGMVAVEGGLATSSGAVFNELPDRLADPLLIVPTGYLTGYAWGPEIAWAAALLALLTANVRTLGGSLGLKEDFRGPMAKPHRMAAMTLGLLLAALGAPSGLAGLVLLLTLAVVLLGTALTVARRTRAILLALEAR
ncbi:CDP-alcohol phosphatidyltransferase family protein [Thiocystis violacea]|uniref:CDP-alcohol phosphatidyltransferase family protein n=1 Tax=Thiocystis violacea TaxID=13725 RepID=UPI001904BB31|nr:CDP-alcohol phosphatidyltransferase family protein [Thiocystis violacea]MBK1725215.1 phosphatidylglycerophosphate synthase [Thiocystis violacea]